MQENSQTTINYQPDNRLRQAVATQNTRLVRVLLTSELNNEERSTEDLFNMLHYVSDHLPQTFAADLEHKTDEILSDVTRCDKAAFRRQQIYLQDHFSRARLEQLILIRSTLIENTHPLNRIEMEELHKVIEETADDPDKQEELQALLDAIQQVSAYNDEYTTAARANQQNSATIPLDPQTPQNKSSEQTADEMPVLATINHDEDEHLPKEPAEHSSKAILIVVVVIVIVIGVWLIQQQ